MSRSQIIENTCVVCGADTRVKDGLCSRCEKEEKENTHGKDNTIDIA